MKNNITQNQEEALHNVLGTHVVSCLQEEALHNDLGLRVVSCLQVIR
jgi:hypothetical protein